MADTFKDKVILITGGGSGIGRETTLAFAREGARISIWDVNEAGGNESLEMIKDLGSEAIFLQVDVADPKAVQQAVSETIKKFGQLDAAVNNAGIGGAHAATHDYPADDWQQVMNVNLSGCYYCMKSEIPALLQNPSGGAIVNVSSIAGLLGFPGHSAYVASKHGVIGLTKSAALEYATYNLRINAVCPAFTRTPMVDQLEEARPELKGNLPRGIPLKRLGTPQEIAAAILYLCSDAASFITGHALPLDGGLMAQ